MAWWKMWKKKAEKIKKERKPWDKQDGNMRHEEMKLAEIAKKGRKKRYKQKKTRWDQQKNRWENKGWDVMKREKNPNKTRKKKSRNKLTKNTRRCHLRLNVQRNKSWDE